MRYKVGAEQLERVPAMAYRPGGVYRTTRAPVGPAHAVDAGSGRCRLWYPSLAAPLP
jgi:hypothetical protein